MEFKLNALIFFYIKNLTDSTSFSKMGRFDGVKFEVEDNFNCNMSVKYQRDVKILITHLDMWTWIQMESLAGNIFKSWQCVCGVW